MRLFETSATFTAVDTFTWFSHFSFFQWNLPEQRCASLLMEPQLITMVNTHKSANNSERASSHSKSQLSGGTEKRDASFRGWINVNGSISITFSSLIKQQSSSNGDKAVFMVTCSLYLLCFVGLVCVSFTDVTSANIPQRCCAKRPLYFIVACVININKSTRMEADF